VREDLPTLREPYRWTKAHSVNIAVLDKQHERLFETMNELHQALRHGSGSAAIDLVLVRLVDYVQEHFAAEESLMDHFAFPGFAAHKAEHEMFRKKLDGFLNDHRAEKAGVPVSVMLLMQSWRKDHVMTTDKQYSAFLNALGVR